MRLASPRHLLLALLAVLPLAAAQAQTPADGSATRWGLGLAVATQQQPYRGRDDETRALPLLSFENRWLRVAGTGIDLKLPDAGPVWFALRARYAAFDGYEPDDAPILAGMDERKGGVWLGGAAGWRSPVANLSFEWLGDASDHSKGQQIRLAVDRSFRTGRFELTPRLAVVRLDKKYVDYYYGVRASEVAAGRPQYDGQDTVNAEIGLRGGYAFDRHHSLFMDASVTRLGGEIEDSPLVDRRTVSGLRFGYLYSF